MSTAWTLFPSVPMHACTCISVKDVSGSDLPNWRSGTPPPGQIRSGLPPSYQKIRCSARCNCVEVKGFGLYWLELRDCLCGSPPSSFLLCGHQFLYFLCGVPFPFFLCGVSFPFFPCDSSLEALTILLKSIFCTFVDFPLPLSRGMIVR